MTTPDKKIALPQMATEDHAKAAVAKLAATPSNSAPTAPFLSHNRRDPATTGPADLLQLETRIVAKLREVFDPELPINIYDLGLIYDLQIAPDYSVSVHMTLTAPGCPVAGTLPGEVQRKIEELPEVPRATVELVWAPQWGKEMMSEAALLELGLM